MDIFRQISSTKQAFLCTLKGCIAVTSEYISL